MQKLNGLLYVGSIKDYMRHIIDLLGANEIHTFAIYSTHPRTAILDVNFVQQVLEKTIVLSFIHLMCD